MVSEVSPLPVFVFVGKISSLIGVMRASSTVSGEARGASGPFIVAVGLIDRMLLSCVCEKLFCSEGLYIYSAPFLGKVSSRVCLFSFSCNNVYVVGYP